METVVKEKVKVKLKRPVLIEGLPGLGMVGKIAAKYLIRELKAEKLAELYSPHFPYYVVVNKKGSVRLLRGEFYFWKNKKGNNDLILMTGDSQAKPLKDNTEFLTAYLISLKNTG